MKRDENSLEKYLNEFRPRKVKALQVPRPRVGMRLVRLALAAVVLICAAGGVWYGRWTKVKVTPTATLPADDSQVSRKVAMKNAFTLTKLALEDERQFQAELAQESRAVLPTFQDTRSTLHALTKE